MAESATEVLAREHVELNDAFTRVRDENADRAAAWKDAVKMMSSHVAIERTFVYPLIKHRHLGSAHLAGDLRHDYGRMEHLLVLTERRKLNSPDMVELVTELLDLFEAHCRRCADEVVPAMDQALGPDDLDELGAKMEAAEHVIVTHPHPHLLALGPVYPITTRVASKWDRMRDRTVRNR